MPKDQIQITMTVKSPVKTESKTALIITNKDDFTVDHLIKRLQYKGLNYIRLNTEDFPEKISGVYDSQHQNFHFYSEKWTFDAKSISSIWYRRPVLPKLKKLDSYDAKFGIRESWEFLQNFWLFAKNNFWIHHPNVLLSAERKIGQLNLAQQTGLLVPDTIVTNSKEKARQFYLEQNKKVIAKPISHGGYGSDNEQAIFTNDLEQENHDFEGLEFSPVILQKKIIKTKDVRVTFFGDKVFAYLIKTQQNELDWRKTNNKDVTYERIDLPIPIFSLLKKFLHRSSLFFSAFDFVIDTDENWYFIESNPNGQWAWFDILNDNFDMADSMIGLLYDY